MKVLLSGAPEYMDRRVGYGNASFFVYNSLKKLGVDIEVRKLGDRTPSNADIELYFGFPEDYNFLVSDGYKIGYTPWESTSFKYQWYNQMQKCDEIWTTSTWCRNVFEKNLPDKPVFPYIHGINPAYQTKKRKHDPSKPFTFLYIGEPAVRKNGNLVARAFAELYGNNPNYQLIIKGTHSSAINIKKDSMPGITISPNSIYSNIKVVVSMYTQAEMIQLYEMADVFLYPTWGEGFGFNPLQAMAMGIPTICTYDWADYKEYITVPIDSKIHPSPWPEIHPGYMYKPDEDQFLKAMASAKENHPLWCDIAFKNGLKLHQEFNWEKVSRAAYGRLKKIYKNL